MTEGKATPGKKINILHGASGMLAKEELFYAPKESKIKLFCIILQDCFKRKITNYEEQKPLKINNLNFLK
jgi:hypothetical protein